MAERSRRVTVAAAGLACTLAGAGLAGYGIGRSTRSQTKAPVPAAYSQPAACNGCGVVLSSVEAQARNGSSLLVVKGTWPSSISAMTSDVRLEAAPEPGGGEQIDVVLRAAPDGRGFVALPAGTPSASSVAVGLASGALLIDIPTATLAPPFRFAVGTWDGHAYTDRLPTVSELRWAGSGAPALMPAPPPASPATTAQPEALAPRDPVTALADRCAAIPGGAVPAYLQVAALTTGTGTDPRLHVTAPYVAIRTAQPVGTTPRALPPFSFAAVLLPPAAAPPAPSPGLAVDRAGTTQLWMTWDGAAFHKAVRTWGGQGWVTATDTQAGSLTAVLTSNGAAFYDSRLGDGGRVGVITASAAGCSAFALDGALTPRQAVQA